MGKLINRIPGSFLFISNLPGSALRTHVESFGKPRDVNKRLKALPGKLDIKRHSPSILYLSVTSHINCIVARCLINVVYLTACCLYQVMMTLHFLSDVANHAESTQNKITSLSLV